MLEIEKITLKNKIVDKDNYFEIGYCEELKIYMMHVFVSWIASYYRYYKIDKEDYNLYKNSPQSFYKKYENEIQSLQQLEEQPIIAFKKDFLRFMLSDGAAAFLLENRPSTPASLKIEWMDAYSYANELEACMYAGGDKLANGDIKPWSDYSTDEWLSESIFSIKQDVKLLNENILVKGAESMKKTLEKHNLSPCDISYFLPHISSCYFKDRLYDELKTVGIDIPKEKWFLNLTKVGNVGAASAYLMVEELMNSGKLKSGDTILLSVPESGRFSYTYAFLKKI